MTLNNISAFGSPVDALIICNYSTTIGSATYAAGEPFTYLRQVNVSIDSASETPQTTVNTPSNRGMQLVDAVNYINRLVIAGVPMTNKVKSLFFKPAETMENVDWITVTAPTVKLEHADPVKVVLYKDGALLTAGTDYTITDHVWLEIAEFDETASYFGAVTYTDNTLCRFITDNYPYFKVVLFAKGNVNGKTAVQKVILDKVSLMPQTSFSFDPSTQNNVTLVFGVIQPEKTVAIKI